MLNKSFAPYAGMDESGKGDLFGPLVTACIIVKNQETINYWVEKGIKDSKKIKSDNRINYLFNIIQKTNNVVIAIKYLNMYDYNLMYKKLNYNLNDLLAWMHSQSLTAGLKRFKVEYGILDKFSNKNYIEKYFNVKNFNLNIIYKAEYDTVVAAASIVARAIYIQQLNILSSNLKIKLHKGCGSIVKNQAIQLFKIYSINKCQYFMKSHFKTFNEAHLIANKADYRI